MNGFDVIAIKGHLESIARSLRSVGRLCDYIVIGYGIYAAFRVLQVLGIIHAG